MNLGTQDVPMTHLESLIDRAESLSNKIDTQTEMIHSKLYGSTQSTNQTGGTIADSGLLSRLGNVVKKLEFINDSFAGILENTI